MDVRRLGARCLRDADHLEMENSRFHFPFPLISRNRFPLRLSQGESQSPASVRGASVVDQMVPLCSLICPRSAPGYCAVLLRRWESQSCLYSVFRTPLWVHEKFTFLPFTAKSVPHNGVRKTPGCLFCLSEHAWVPLPVTGCFWVNNRTNLYPTHTFGTRLGAFTSQF
jgi:hypothetical protein